MKALILSGGGSKGAYVGGMLEYMKLVDGREYELYLGTSTGTLLQTLTSINRFDKLKEAYTSITLDDIYRVSPFKPGKDPENPKINLWGILNMHFLHKEPTFGDSNGLKDLIYRFFPKDLYDQTLDSGKILVAAVTNMDKAMTEHYSSKELGKEGYSEFVDWTWISCNAVPFTSLVKRNEMYYADGGFTEHIPIRKAIEMGATHIDAISTKPMIYAPINKDLGRNPLRLLERMIDILLWESAERDMEVVKNMALKYDVTLNIYHMPRTLTDNSMYFDKDVMTKWWDEGYEYAKELFGNKNKEFIASNCIHKKFKKHA
jgi:NTE family protein